MKRMNEPLKGYDNVYPIREKLHVRPSTAIEIYRMIEAMEPYQLSLLFSAQFAGIVLRDMQDSEREKLAEAVYAAANYQGVLDGEASPHRVALALLLTPRHL